MKYTISKHEGEYTVANAKGIIIAYCNTRAMAEDIKRAQLLDDDRHSVEDAYNEQQEARALRAAFIAEFC